VRQDSERCFASAREDAREIFLAGVRSVDPRALTTAYLERRDRHPRVCDADRSLAEWCGKPLVLGAGKAAARMALACEDTFGAARLEGMVVVPKGCEAPLESVQIVHGDHPIPGHYSERAGNRLRVLLRSVRHGPILWLLSGGASSLVALPRAGLSMVDKRATVKLLLACGADIRQVNTVRKHLSDVKGGGVLRLTEARPIISLILSDVLGDDPAVIGSGPTAVDPTTFADALEVLRRRRVIRSTPPGVLAYLRRGMRGEYNETVKVGDPCVRGVVNLVIGGNWTALRAAAGKARELGYRTIVQKSPLTGESRTTARTWFRGLRDGPFRAGVRPVCVLAGGETTVTVRGPGRGGRNQEFALALARPIRGLPVVVLSGGTDGIDGPTPAAGAFVDGRTWSRASAIGLTTEEFLRRNDSYGFFRRLGDNLVTGPTGTNVMDLKVALLLPYAGTRTCATGLP
jgi:glycerate 2-kinase